MEKSILILPQSLERYNKKFKKHGIIVNDSKIEDVVFEDAFERRMVRMVRVKIEFLMNNIEYDIIGMLKYKDDIKEVLHFYDVPKEYKTGKIICDHCKSNRFRKKGYIIKNNKTNEIMSVGSTCLDNFIPKNICSSIVKFEDFIDDDIKEASEVLPKKLIIARIYEEIKNYGFYSKKEEFSTAYSIKEQIENKPFYDVSEKFKKECDDFFKFTKNLPLSDFNDILKQIVNSDSINIDPFQYLGFLCAGINSFFKSMIKKEAVINPLNLEEINKKRYKNEQLIFLSSTSYDTEYGTTFIYRFKDIENRPLTWKTSNCSIFEKDVKYNITFTACGFDEKYKTNTIKRCKVKYED